MSTVERNKGTLEETLWNIILQEFPNADIDDLEWDTNGKYVRIKDKFYRVDWEVKSERDCSYFCEVEEDYRSGLTHFHTLHYNGGAHWTELVEEKLNE